MRKNEGMVDRHECLNSARLRDKLSESVMEAAEIVELMVLENNGDSGVKIYKWPGKVRFNRDYSVILCEIDNTEATARIPYEKLIGFRLGELGTVLYELAPGWKRRGVF